MWERLDPEIHHIGAYINSATFALCGRPGSRYSPEDLLLHTQVPAFDTEPVHTARQGRYYGIQTTIAIAASCSVQYIFRACIKRIRWKKVCIDPLYSCFCGRTILAGGRSKCLSGLSVKRTLSDGRIGMLLR